MTELRTKSWHRSKPFQRCKLKITCLCKLCTHVCVYFGVFYNSRNYADPHFRAVGYNHDAILASSFFDVDSRIASEFSLNLHAALPGQRPGVIPRNTPTKALVSLTIGRQPSNSGPGASIAGLQEPFGSTPWRRCDVWIHDPIRPGCLMGARQHPRYSPYVLLN